MVSFVEEYTDLITEKVTHSSLTMLLFIFTHSLFFTILGEAYKGDTVEPLYKSQIETR